MTDLSLIDILLMQITTYGSLALGFMLFLGAVGIPLPTTLLVVAAGTSAQQGVIDWGAAVGFGLLGAVGGDHLSYGLGRFAEGWVQRQFGQVPIWQRARENFEQRGAAAVYLTRFLLTPLAIPTNLIAGGSGYAWRRFLAYDTAGELTWLVLYGGLGYAFGSQWQLISQAISDYSSWFGAGVLVAIGIYFRSPVIRYIRSVVRPPMRYGNAEVPTTHCVV